jgi:hypothetical protein
MESFTKKLQNEVFGCLILLNLLIIMKFQTHKSVS